MDETDRSQVAPDIQSVRARHPVINTVTIVPSPIAGCPDIAVTWTFDINNVPDPTAPENIRSVHGRGMHVIKSLMDEGRFEEGGAAIHMRKSVGDAPKLGEAIS
jgi:hypothetical protein